MFFFCRGAIYRNIREKVFQGGFNVPQHILYSAWWGGGGLDILIRCSWHPTWPFFTMARIPPKFVFFSLCFMFVSPRQEVLPNSKTEFSEPFLLPLDFDSFDRLLVNWIQKTLHADPPHCHLYFFSIAQNYTISVYRILRVLATAAGYYTGLERSRSHSHSCEGNLTWSQIHVIHP